MASTLAVSEWTIALQAVFAEPERIRPVFQPIFDLQRGVVCGFEMLARFDYDAFQATPDKWFAAAAREGRGEELEAALIDRGLQARSRLPENCFLAVNVGPDACAR